MTLEQIEQLDRTMLTPADVAEYLEADALSIRLQARNNPRMLGFPVIIMGNRVKIPKDGFLAYCRGMRAFCSAEAQPVPHETEGQYGSLPG